MSNAETLQQNNTRLSGNNADLTSILNTVNNLPVNVEVSLQEKSVIPTTSEQEIVADSEYTGLSKVTVAGDSNLLPENIKAGSSIFGVEGIAKTSSAKITDATYLFYNGVRIDYLHEILKLCENVTDMKYMFYGCQNLEELDLSNIDASNVTSMNYMFYNCSNLINLDLSNIDASNVTSMIYMFNNCSNLTNLDLSNFITKSVTNMQSMFYNCSNLTNLDLSSFDTSDVTNMSYMFYGCQNLEELNLSSFDTSKVTNMQSMFADCKKLTKLALSNFNTSNLTNIGSMFNGCYELEELDLSNSDFSKVNSINGCLSYCYKLTNLSGFKNLGKGYTSKSNNYSSYWLDLSKTDGLLTYESLMNVINNLYDLNLTYNVANGGTLYTQKISLRSDDKAKLTAEEIAIATNKGWTVA